MDGTVEGGATPSALSADRPAGGLRHIGAVARSADHLVALGAAFLADGLRDGDLTVVSCTPATVDRLAAALGRSVPSLVPDARLGLVGTRAPDAFAAVRDLARRAAVGSRTGRLRVLTEVLVHSPARDRREGERYEAAANAVLATAPVTGLCLYDGTGLAAAEAAAVAATHPVLLDDGAERLSTGYRDPREHVRSLPLPREPVESSAPVLRVDAARTLPELRHALAAVVDTWVRDPEQREDLRLGLAEVAANAFRHGGRPVSARAWVAADRLVCTVTDGGDRPVDVLAGFVPAHGDDLSRGGMGLWLARKLFDSVDLLPGPSGLTVRLAVRLS